jgi:hypothetical protein
MPKCSMYAPFNLLLSLMSEQLVCPRADLDRGHGHSKARYGLFRVRFQMVSVMGDLISYNPELQVLRRHAK